MTTDSTTKPVGPSEVGQAAKSGSCCGAAPASDATTVTSTCCGTVAEARAEGGCCGAAAKERAVASGVGCC
jgi:hypothetical protein